MAQIITNTTMHLVSQQAVDEQLRRIERRISQIGRLWDGERIKGMVGRTLEQINTLRQLDLITETEAVQFYERTTQAGKESSENAACGIGIPVSGTRNNTFLF